MKMNFMTDKMIGIDCVFTSFILKQSMYCRFFPDLRFARLKHETMLLTNEYN